MKKRTACVVLSLCVVAVRADAQELIAGWEGDQSRGYGFVSPMISSELDASSNLVWRAAVSYLYYTYMDAETTIDVSSPGLSAGVGYRFRRPRLTATFGPTLEIRRTTRERMGLRTRAWERGAGVQGDVYFQPTALVQLMGLASYNHANRYTWLRVGLKRQVTNTSFHGSRTLGAGVEITGQGNRDQQAQQVGGVLELAFLRARASLQFRAGVARSTSRGSMVDLRPYFGAGFYRAF